MRSLPSLITSRTKEQNPAARGQMLIELTPPDLIPYRKSPFGSSLKLWGGGREEVDATSGKQ
jgi:hypothetical protein